jgi:indolepyruvate ferredoxin oxidoreductase
LPLSLAAIERAVELNGQAVEFNKRALALGRLAAHDYAAVERLLAGVQGPAVPAAAPSFDDVVASRAGFLTDYQDRAYADGYLRLVHRVRESERQRGLTGLAEAVAHGYFKLLAYKDEYEVARLHSSPSFLEQLGRTFEGEYQLRFHLAPPLLSRPDPRTGLVRKREYGAWMLPVFRLLARLKGLRGTRLDPFGWLPDRKLERQLIADYERLIEELLAQLEPGKHAVAIELASLPAQVRGYGHVKRRHLEAVRARERELLQQWRAAAEVAQAA